MDRASDDTTGIDRTRDRRMRRAALAVAARRWRLRRCSRPARAGAKRIRFAHPAPTAHGWHIWAEQFKKAIEEKTGGKLTVQIFPNAQMGNERDTAQAVRLGSLEMGAIGVGLMNWVPEMSITDAPFLWKSRAQCVERRSTGAFGDDLRKRSLDKGFVLTGWTDLGFRCMTNNKHPINSAEGHAGPEDARAELQGLHRDDAGDRRLDGRGRLERALSRAAPGRGRRPGHAAVGGEVEQVLRGAEVHLQDRPHADHRLHGREPASSTTA